MSAFERRNRLVKARSRGIILMGMDLDDVTHILGRPDDVDTSTSSSGTCQRLTWFKDHRVDHYIRMCGGKVEYHSR
ncbi:hypothetical protein [Halomonas ventosae]|uniref:Uncharacterized protein n=1 Tax=Halomonas ventosae TaxID=229007 RepID=A0A2T0VR46_9GAMM|nr:hypothetical protein [Halomonas ventosae]PRY72988.1 hypothetical protein BCL64_10267 [Halomonas ventosae]